MISVTSSVFLVFEFSVDEENIVDVPLTMLTPKQKNDSVWHNLALLDVRRPYSNGVATTFSKFESPFNQSEVEIKIILSTNH